MSRTPSLEIHVPISPTPAFLLMTHYLVRSLRARGGGYRDARVILSIGDDRRNALLQLEHPWLDACDVEVRWIAQDRFARHSWFATACERFLYPYSSDVVMMLDADTLIAGAIDELVHTAHESRALCGVIAHVPPFSLDHWRRLYATCGLGELTTPCEHTGWGYMFNDASLRFCPPYFNLGVLAAPAGVMRSIGEELYALMETVAAMDGTYYRLQVAISLALKGLALPFRTMSFRWNFANDPLLEALHASELDDVRIVHLMRKHQLSKLDLYRTIADVESMLARTDLRVINALAQGIIGEIHPVVKSEHGEIPLHA